MRVFKGLNNLPPFRNAVATMGSFDGVHGGHGELLHRVVSTAAASDGESIVLTFEPHPRYVLGSGDGLRLLSTLDEKLWLLERAGIDNVIVVPFTEEFSRTSPRDFIENDIAGIGIRRLVVGYNHRFGHNKEGDFNFLESRNTGIGIEMVEQQQVAESKVSSTIIRRIVACGMMDKARMLLGHPYIIMCQAASDGTLSGIASHKQLPAAGDYEAVVDGRATTLTVADDGLRIGSDNPKGKIIIEL